MVTYVYTVFVYSSVITNTARPSSCHNAVGVVSNSARIPVIIAQNLGSWDQDSEEGFVK